MDGRTDRCIKWNQHTPFNFVDTGYNDAKSYISLMPAVYIW